MDPERNQGINSPSAGNDTAAVVPVSVDVEPVADEVTVPAAVAPEAPQAPAAPQPKQRRTRPKAGTHPNNVRRLRQGGMMSKAELARRAGVSPLTIDRVEAGCPCRMDTKRKILEALGLQPSAAKEVFPDLDLP
ncbi:MAG: helix-turn-helix domain-containing protein [Deltaproteobacteria bacterium]|nr:helix-turn-helix domain-containing protein [Deltaproteobacteria bacterium]